jgi:type I restriction enzyme S subunit
MSTKWAKVRLGELLQRVERFEPRDELTEYQFAGTYSFARGIFVGEWKLGSTFSLPKVQRVHEGDFVYCKIMAWEGAFGLVPKEADGCVMSGAFIVYELNRDQIESKFLSYFFRVPRNWQTIGSQSSGTNVRRQSLHPNQFEEARVPLPPLDEQRRIVARIEELAAKIEEVRRLRRESIVESGALLYAELRGIFCSRQPQILLGDALELHRGFDLPVQQRILGPYPVLAANGEIGRHAESRVKGPGVCTGRSGSVGAVNYVEDDFWPLNTALYVSDFKGNNPRLIYYLLLSVSSELKQVGAHTAVPTLDRKKAHSQIRIHVPPVSEQQQIVDNLDGLAAKIDEVKRNQRETAAELDALLLSILDKAFKGEL